MARSLVALFLFACGCAPSAAMDGGLDAVDRGPVMRSDADDVLLDAGFERGAEDARTMDVMDATTDIVVRDAAREGGDGSACDDTIVPGTTRLSAFVNNGNLRTDGNIEWPIGTMVSVLEYVPLWGMQFPSRNGTGAIPLRAGEYAAMAFRVGASTGADTPWGGMNFAGLNWVSAQQNGGGEAHVAISECPGDFRHRLPHPTRCVAGPSVNGSIGWLVGVSGSRCPLEANKTYYLNIAFFDDAGVSTCSNPLCHFFAQPN